MLVKKPESSESSERPYMSQYDKGVEIRLQALEEKLNDLIKKLERKMTL